MRKQQAPSPSSTCISPTKVHTNRTVQPSHSCSARRFVFFLELYAARESPVTRPPTHRLCPGSGCPSCSTLSPPAVPTHLIHIVVCESGLSHSIFLTCWTALSSIFCFVDAWPLVRAFSNYLSTGTHRTDEKDRQSSESCAFTHKCCVRHTSQGQTREKRRLTS